MTYNIIFDIDQTIVDSRSAERFRTERNWEAAYQEIDAGNVKPFTGIVELIHDAKKYGHEIAFVSTSPDKYCRKILEKIGIDIDQFNALVPYSTELYDGSKTKMYKKAIEYFSDKTQPLVIVGDANKDISAVEDPDSAFTIRCLWGLSSERFENDQKTATPFFIMKKVSQLRDFLFNEWPQNVMDENETSYLFDYYPIGKDRYCDGFSKKFFKDIKGGNADDIGEAFERVFGKNRKTSNIYRGSGYNPNMYIGQGKNSTDIKEMIDIKELSIKSLISYIETQRDKLQIYETDQIGIAIVPSSTAGKWNSSLDNIVDKVSKNSGVRNCGRLLIRHTTKEKSHQTNDRSIQNNIETMKINDAELLNGLSALIILDDITTSGNTFEACTEVIKRDSEFRGNILNFALAKTQDFYLGNVDTCEASRTLYEKCSKYYDDYSDLEVDIDQLISVAEAGDMKAQYELGFEYELGFNIDKDESKAVEWYRKAAEQGYADAQFSLGFYYTDKDDEKAVEWYRKAAEQGNIDGQISLGLCYSNGKGIEIDQEKAVEWLKKAADQGDRVAIDFLKELL